MIQRINHIYAVLPVYAIYVPLEVTNPLNEKPIIKNEKLSSLKERESNKQSALEEFSLGGILDVTI